jgi:hypothetical protein
MRDNPDLNRRFELAQRESKMVSRQLWVREGEILSLDIWEEEEHRTEFRQKNEAVIREWEAAIGATEAESKVWREPYAEELFPSIDP